MDNHLKKAPDRGRKPAKRKPSKEQADPPLLWRILQKARGDDSNEVPQHNDPWRAYHAVIALLALVGAFAGVANLGQLIHYIETRSAIEESGLVACATIVSVNVLYYLTMLVRWIARILR